MLGPYDDNGAGLGGVLFNGAGNTIGFFSEFASEEIRVRVSPDSGIPFSNTNALPCSGPL